MSMQLALRPYVTAGVAIVGASVIAVTPIAPHPTMPDLRLTAAIDNPVAVFAPVVSAAGSWLDGVVRAEVADPFPILAQIFRNQQYTVGQIVASLNGAREGLQGIATGLPATLQAAGALIAAGDVNGAINKVMSDGLAPITALIFNTWTPLQPALQRPFAVLQAMVPALFDAGLALVLGTISSTVGLGFVFGAPPFVQQLVTTTQNVLGAIATLDPVNVINAIQDGIADIAQNAIDQLHTFTDVGGTIDAIRNAILNALQTPAAGAVVTAAAGSAAIAAVPDVSATLVGVSTPDAPARDAAAPGAESPLAATPSAPDAVTDDAATGEPETTATDPVATEVPLAADAPTEAVGAESPVADGATTEEAGASDATSAPKGSTTVVRDSTKAVPGAANPGVATNPTTGHTGASTTAGASSTDTTGAGDTSDGPAKDPGAKDPGTKDSGTKDSGTGGAEAA